MSGRWHDCIYAQGSDLALHRCMSDNSTLPSLRVSVRVRNWKNASEIQLNQVYVLYTQNNHKQVVFLIHWISDTSLQDTSCCQAKVVCKQVIWKWIDEVHTDGNCVLLLTYVQQLGHTHTVELSCCHHKHRSSTQGWCMLRSSCGSSNSEGRVFGALCKAGHTQELMPPHGVGP